MLICSLGCLGADGVGSAGNEQCAGCHPREHAGHRRTGMARALERADQGEILRSRPSMRLRVGAYSYRVERDGGRSVYRVSDGREEFRAPLQWAFGLGAAGQTYLFQRNGQWYESRVSFYKEANGLDLTVGAAASQPRSLEEAIGRPLSVKDARDCFDCHATGVGSSSVDVGRITPGVQCGRCHEKAVEHAASVLKKGTMRVMPARLKGRTAEESSEFCGQCHRTWATIAAEGPHHIGNVRFQPYRLANSKCYDTTDSRISCTACHDPHKTDTSDVAYQDARCRACHEGPAKKAGAKHCKTGGVNCSGCHMPKIEIKEAHHGFTDHWIRVVRPGEPPPY